MLSRRGFFGALAALTVAPRLRSLFPVRPPPIGGINRATFTFWRSQQTADASSAVAFDNLRASMRDVYDRCQRG